MLPSWYSRFHLLIVIVISLIISKYAVIIELSAFILTPYTCKGRANRYVQRKLSTCAGLMLIGSFNTIQVTLSNKGGVVREPS